MDQRKKVSKSEKKNISIARKSLFASKNIKGEKFSFKNLVCLRPGTGISPMEILKICRKRAKRNFLKMK